MRKDKLAAQKAVVRDLTAIALPTKLPLKKIISMLQDLTLEAIKTGNTDEIEKVCQSQLLALLNANTEVAVLKGGRRSQLAAEKVIDEPVSEYMPVRFSLQDSGIELARDTSLYLKNVSGIDPAPAQAAIQRQNNELVTGLTQEIVDTISKTIEDLHEQGVHVSGGKKEITNILLKAGIDPTAAPRLAETLFRTQSAVAYNAGRINEANDPDTAPYIWGFEYVTAHDRRVRPEHRLLEGVRLPKEDKFWTHYLPPNGWNCRCTILEIWKDEDIAKVDFGITGVDPRKRNPKELNLLPAFDGNVGILQSIVKKPATAQTPGGTTVQKIPTAAHTAPATPATQPTPGGTATIGSQVVGAAETATQETPSAPQSLQEQLQVAREQAKEQSAAQKGEVVESSAEPTVMIIDVRPYLAARENNRRKKNDGSTDYEVFIEPKNGGREFNVNSWNRKILGKILQRGVSFARSAKQWKGFVSATNEKPCDTFADALDFVLTEAAKVYRTTKDHLKVVWTNRQHAMSDRSLIQDWKEFCNSQREEFRRLIGAWTPKNGEKYGNLVITENPMPYQINWGLTTEPLPRHDDKDDHEFLNGASPITDGIIYYDREIGKYYFSTGSDFSSTGYTYPTLARVVNVLLAQCRRTKINSIGFDSTTQRVFEPVTEAICNVANHRDFAGGSKLVYVDMYENSQYIHIQADSEKYDISYNRFHKTFMVQTTDEPPRILLEGKSILNVLHQFLSDLNEDSADGITTHVRAQRAFTTFRGGIVKPFNDRIVEKLGKQDGGRVTNKEIATYIDNLTPLEHISVNDSSSSPVSLERRGIQVDGTTDPSIIRLQDEVLTFMEENEFSPSTRVIAERAQVDRVAGCANRETRKTEMVAKSRTARYLQAEKNAASGWWTPGDEHHVFVHEDTHHLMSDIMDVLGEERVNAAFKTVLAEIGAGLFHADDETMNADTAPWPEMTMNKMFEDYQKTPNKDDCPDEVRRAQWEYIDKLKKTFSVYGATISNAGDPWGEACSEARAEVLCKGKGARPYSKKIYAIIVKLYFEAKKKGSATL